MKARAFFRLLLVSVFSIVGPAWIPWNFCLAQSESPSPEQVTPTGKPAESLEKQFIQRLLPDQKAIWGGPLHANRHDLIWLAPFFTATGVLLADDRQAMEEVPNTKDVLNASRNLSRLGAGYSTVGLAGGFYLLGRLTNNQRARETGLLGAEVLIGSFSVSGVLKLAAGRERPTERRGDGRFFKGRHSFPSGHAMTTWSLAAVIAEQYKDHKVVPFAAYGVATLISASRSTGREHFASDVLVGSVVGWLIGRYVVTSHLTEASQPSRRSLKSRFIPIVAPQYDAGTPNKGVSLIWNF